MKIIINGIVNSDSIEIFLKEQKDKVKKIEEFCKENKIKELDYKDSILEYSYKKVGVKGE